MGLDEALQDVRRHAVAYRQAPVGRVEDWWEDFNLALCRLVAAAVEYGANGARPLSHEAVAAMEAE